GSVGVHGGYVRPDRGGRVGHDGEQLAELALLLVALLLRFPQILDVEHGPVPSDDGARSVELRVAACQVPAILTVGAADAKDVFVGLSERQALAPMRQDSGSVVGMDVGAPTESRRIPVPRRKGWHPEEVPPAP